MDNMTAKVSCFARAYHYKTAVVRIFDDPAAELLLGEDYDRIAQSMMDGFSFFLPGFQGSPEDGLRLIVDRQLSPSVLARSACCEQSLDREKRNGCCQYVMFAAGYDTFALRNRDSGLSVFELDLPGMLADKKQRIESFGLRSGAVFVPCDLSEDGWTELLLKKGFDTEKKAFGSLLGISYYLSKYEFTRLLRAISGIMPAGSTLCFDYPAVNGGMEEKINRTLAQGAGEQMKARYSRPELERLLRESGFLIREHLNDIKMTARFFSEHNSAEPEHPMRAPAGVGYVLAVRV